MTPETHMLGHVVGNQITGLCKTVVAGMNWTFRPEFADCEACRRIIRAAHYARLDRRAA